MKKTFRKSIISTIMLSILLFSLAAYASPLAQADPIGVGKFVDVEVVGGGGKVILTKLSSGESWDTSEYNDHLVEEKLGAGTVGVEAFVYVNYIFDHWELNGDTVNGEGDEGLWFEFKTSKGVTNITAYFVEQSFTVIAEVIEVETGIFNGTISLTEFGERKTYWEETVNNGDDLDLWLNPIDDNHVSGISIDGVFSPLTNPISLLNIKKNYYIQVFFSQDGYAFVPAGLNVATYFTQGASLQFNETTGAEEPASGLSLVFPTGWAIFLWDINTEAIDLIDGNVTIALEFTGDEPTAVYRSESEEALYCDVNNDGIVDSTDNSLVAIAIKAYKDGSKNGKEADPLYDTNRDGDLTQEDLHLIHDYYGTIFDYLEFTIVGNTIYVETDHFSIFRGR